MNPLDPATDVTGLTLSREYKRQLVQLGPCHASLVWPAIQFTSIVMARKGLFRRNGLTCHAAKSGWSIRVSCMQVQHFFNQMTLYHHLMWNNTDSNLLHVYIIQPHQCYRASYATAYSTITNGIAWTDVDDKRSVFVEGVIGGFQICLYTGASKLPTRCTPELGHCVGCTAFKMWLRYALPMFNDWWRIACDVAYQALSSLSACNIERSLGTRLWLPQLTA